MKNHRKWLGVVIGTMLIGGCATVNRDQAPATSPADGVPVPEKTTPPAATRSPSVQAKADAPESARGIVNERDWSSSPPSVSNAISVQSVDGPGPPFIFAARRASEGLDLLAGLVTIRHEKRGDVITLPCDKMVEPGQWTITTSGQFTLKEVAPGLRDQDGHVIIIQGYTDSLGTSAVNDALSLRRAESVRDFFTTQGVAGESMRAEGLGARRPVAGNGTADGRAQNRRIEIVITR